MEEITLDRVSFAKFCFRVSIVLCFCIGHGFGGAIVNWVCDAKQNKSHLGFINPDFMLGERESRGGVN